MKQKLVIFSILTVILFAVTGCAKEAAKAVAVDEKNDKCAVCNMAVMDNQFATEVILENGKALKFDDIGCMYTWMDENKDEKTKAKFVRDYNTKEWIELEKASFVYDKSINTPMAYNVISFKNKQDAEAFTKEHTGDVLTFKELESHNWERNKEMMMKMKEGHGNDMNHSH
ncbi:MAG: nitrous oxide reductase accessory protein NosL [Ectobacillus sp.]